MEQEGSNSHQDYVAANLVMESGIQSANKPLQFVMIGYMAKGDLVHLGFDTWGITETSTLW